MSTLRLANVSFDYGTSGNAGPPVLAGISLALSRGEFVSVIGRSGSGKTSLLNLAAGFLRPTSGRISLDGRDITGPSPDRAVVFQDNALYPWLNTRDNVAFSLRLSGVPKAERHRIADDLLQQVGLAREADRRIWELSGGQRQRIGIARALAADPGFLLMDEPLGALDAMTREKMHELLLSVWTSSNTGVLLITHSVEEAVFLSTRVVVLAPHPGRIIREIPVEFGRRFVVGESARLLKSDPEFVRVREELVSAIYEDEGAYA